MKKMDAKVSREFLAAGIIAGAFFLRLMGLGKGIWMDEYLTLKMLSLPDFLQALKFHDHPPLYYVLLKAWSHICDSVVFLRIFSVLCGIGAVVTLMAWIRQYSKTASLLAGIYAATLPLMLRYSQEIVDYPLLLFATALSFFLVNRVVASAECPAACSWDVPLDGIRLRRKGVGNEAGNKNPKDTLRLAAESFISSPTSRFGYLGLAVSLSAVVLSHALGIVVVAAVVVYYFLRSSLQKKIGHGKVIFAFGVSFFVFVFFVLLFLHGIKKDPAVWWVPPFSAEWLYYVARSLLGLERISALVSVIFILSFFTLLFLGDWKRSWPMLASAIFYWIALIGYSVLAVPVLIDRTALPGMIPFIGFVGVHIATIKENIMRRIFVVILILLCSMFVFVWFHIADKPIEPTQDAASTLEMMRKQKDIVVIFPQHVDGLIGHYIQLPPNVVLSVQSTDDAVVLEKKIEPMLKMQRLGFGTGARSVFLLMRSSPLFKRRPEVFLWLFEYLKQRFGDPVFFKQFGCFSVTQFKE